MDTFSTLPNDWIYKICEQMDEKTLGRFIRTNARFYTVCNRILEERKANILEEKVRKFNENQEWSHRENEYSWVSLKQGKIKMLFSPVVLKNYLLIPEMKLFGSRDEIILFLKEEGFTGEEIHKLLAKSRNT